MINRLTQRFEGPEPEKPEDEFWEVCGDAGWYYVSPETAEGVLEALYRLCAPRWIRFTDLFGARVCMLARDIRRVSESTRTQREAEREFRRARREEMKADRRPWEDDDWW